VDPEKDEEGRRESSEQIAVKERRAQSDVDSCVRLKAHTKRTKPDPGCQQRLPEAANEVRSTPFWKGLELPASALQSEVSIRARHD